MGALLPGRRWRVADLSAARRDQRGGGGIRTPARGRYGRGVCRSSRRHCKRIRGRGWAPRWPISADGDVERARAVLQTAFDDAGDSKRERRAQLAAIALANGDSADARREIDAVLAANPTALRPLVLLSSIELRQNRRGRGAGSRPSVRSPHTLQSVGALVAGERGSPEPVRSADARANYLDRALAIDPRDVHALVNRARIRFGTDDTAGARDDADRAAAISPEDAQVRSLRGFIRTRRRQHHRRPRGLRVRRSARSRVRRAAPRPRPCALPQNRVERGSRGNADGDAARAESGALSELSRQGVLPGRPLSRGACRRWHRPSASTRATRRRGCTPASSCAIRTSRSRRSTSCAMPSRSTITAPSIAAGCLLDRDLATKNVSLAEIYRQLGFEAWGAFEALNSLDTDLTNSSAHLFLAETYGGLSDRTEALEQRAPPVFSLCAGQPQLLQQLLGIHRAHRAAAQTAGRHRGSSDPRDRGFGQHRAPQRQRTVRPRRLLQGVARVEQPHSIATTTSPGVLSRQAVASPDVRHVRQLFRREG